MSYDQIILQATELGEDAGCEATRDACGDLGWWNCQCEDDRAGTEFGDYLDERDPDED